MRGMIRSVLTAVAEGAIKIMTGRGLAGESFLNREYFQHYGFTSRPLPGAEGILLREGNHLVLIASDDRRYRLAVEAGEVALYTDEGDKIHLRRGREIEVVGGAKVVVTTMVAEVTATASATVISPEINLGGAREAMRRLIDERFKTLFDAHVHSGVQIGPGTTGTPTAALVFADHATDVSRGI